MASLIFIKDYFPTKFHKEPMRHQRGNHLQIFTDNWSITEVRGAGSRYLVLIIDPP